MRFMGEAVIQTDGEDGAWRNLGGGGRGFCARREKSGREYLSNEKRDQSRES